MCQKLSTCPINATGKLSDHRTRNVDKLLRILGSCRSINMPIKGRVGQISNGRNKLQLTTQLFRSRRFGHSLTSPAPSLAIVSARSAWKRETKCAVGLKPLSFSRSFALRHCYKTAVHNLISHLALHLLPLDPLLIRLLFSVL